MSLRHPYFGRLPMRSLCILLLCSLSACMIRYDHPNDVRVVGLNVGDSPYKKFEDAGKGEMIDVWIATSFDYASLSESRIISVRFYFCNQMGTRVEGFPLLPLFIHNKDWVDIKYNKSGNPMVEGSYRYHAIMSSFSHEESPTHYGDDSAILDYDLREKPRDICFYIDASALDIPGSIRSNIVRIPKETLTHFFTEHPRRTPSLK